ncbi:MAG TPA: OmpA family protein [Saprospiraceae bacterium]|nr:OmpA family protein [Saprospiraceae bacterium]HRO07987.1 OmpA family protein [Saprospiraceae bacterium]HRO73020.1 OmpA family protein [Saprospiraceae bacterium]
MPAWSQVDSSKVTISRFDKVSTDARVNDIYIDNKNVIWLATNKGLIETVGDGSKVNNYFHNTEMVSITSERKDNIWVASAKAIYNFQTKVSYGLPHDGVTITGITYLDGSVWIGTNNGLYQFVVATSKFKVFDTENSKLASNKINFIQADKNRILWIGTDAGYVRIDGSKWEVQDKKMTMLATSENYEGQWIISNKDMFLLNHYNRLFSVKLDESQYKGKINKFVLDSKGRIYIASDILARYNPYNEQIINYSEDAATLSKAAISIACDKNDNIWIGTNGAGFYKLLFGDVVAEQVNANIIVENNIGCQGSKNGSIKVTVSGGTRPYSYKWSISGTSGTTASGLGAGLYEVTVTDKSQNTSVASITLTDPEPVQIDLVSNNRVTNPENPDGSVYVNITGGAGGYTYNWSNGTKNQNLMNARSGPYTLTVTDKNGCLASSTFHIMREKFIPDLDAKKVIVGQKLRINELNFVSDSSSITQDNYDILNEVYDFLVANPGIIIEIGGHTNTIPPHEYCDQLSTARAKNVAEYLYSRGIPKSRITYKGYGKREPLTDSTSAQGRQKNQRVEIKILQI